MCGIGSVEGGEGGEGGRAHQIAINLPAQTYGHALLSISEKGWKDEE